MSLSGIITLVQTTTILLMLVQVHPELPQAIRDEVLQHSEQAILEAKTTLLAAAGASTTPSVRILQPSNLPLASPLIDVEHTCPIVNPPGFSTTLTAIRDGYDCVTGFSCAPSKEAQPTTDTRRTHCVYNGETFTEGAIRSSRQRVDCSAPSQAQICPLTINITLVCHNGQWQPK